MRMEQGFKLRSPILVGVAAGEQQRAGGRLIVRVSAVVSSRRAPSSMRSASRSPSARGVGSRSASKRGACNAARWASIGSDLPRRR
jgi:hypothetical protein